MRVLYEDFAGTLYEFSLNETCLIFAPRTYEFMLIYKPEIERLNYYSWSHFLEKIEYRNKKIRTVNNLIIQSHF